MKKIVIALLAIAAAGGAYVWRARQPVASNATRSFQGYVEGNFIYVAAEDSGRIDALSVEAGDQVAPGAELFGLESSTQTAQRNEAEARVKQADAQIDNLKAAGQRPEQIAVLEAQEQQARAQLTLTRGEFERQRELFSKGVATKAAFDQAQASFERDMAALAVAQRQIEAGRLAGRTADIAAAEAAQRAAQATLRQSETRLSKRKVAAAVQGRVQDVFFRPGEVVNAGQPVLSILPANNLRLRFYAPETALSQFRIGQIVSVSCDRCKPGQRAAISFISREAEYTPPVIFSQQERAKLGFRLEARPLDGLALPVGLPIDVALADGG